MSWKGWTFVISMFALFLFIIAAYRKVMAEQAVLKKLLAKKKTKELSEEIFVDHFPDVDEILGEKIQIFVDENDIGKKEMLAIKERLSNLSEKATLSFYVNELKLKNIESDDAMNSIDPNYLERLSDSELDLGILDKNAALSAKNSSEDDKEISRLSKKLSSILKDKPPQSTIR